MVTDLNEKLAAYRADDVHTVMLGLVDIDGVIRGKYITLDKFESVMRSSGGFCDCVFGWDVDDQLYEPARLGADPTKAVTGWHTGFPDARFRLVAASERTMPTNSTPYFVGEFVSDETEGHPVCPRSLLNRVTNKLAQQGLSVEAGFEYEFFVFHETPESVRSKNYHALTPFSPGNFGYSVLRAASNSETFLDFMKFCKEFRVELEGLHCETGPGVWEAALKRQPLVESADRAALFKTFAKAFFFQRQAMATFMAKWSMDFPGQSGHFHFSISDQNGKNVLRESDGSLSRIGINVVGGLARYLPEWLPMLAPTVNSYTRLVKGAWAPTALTWGFENRTCALRVIFGSDKSFHIENRIPGADSNPYLVAAATVAASHLGIEEDLEPPSHTKGDAYAVEDGLDAILKFSPTLREAASRFSASKEAEISFGKEFCEHFAMTRLWESSEAERSVNDWQLKRYFEVI